MKKLVVLLFAVILHPAQAQFKVGYNPALQPTAHLQYYTPVGDNLFVGDCIPFYHNETYYLYWLIDKGHHSALNGLGGHQWVVSTTTDLKNWQHYPVVIGIDEDWEKSICTGSVVYAKNKFYAFYATRSLKNGKSTEELSYAVSNDGIKFTKQKPNPFFTAPAGYSTANFRDPKVVVDAQGVFHLFISTQETNASLKKQAGALAHLSSTDLTNWTVNAPVLTGQNEVPECPDYFAWNGWHYLVYSTGGRTYYVKSKNAYGPWEYPGAQTLNEEFANVVKTAAFKNGRRIAAAWIPARENNKDHAREIFGGSAVFRELTQLPDGSLASKFPAEMIPPLTAALNPAPVFGKGSTAGATKEIKVNGVNGIGTAHFENIPVDSRITLEIEPMGANEEYGLYLRADAEADKGYRLNFAANTQTVRLGNTQIEAVSGLTKKIKVDIVMKNDIIDVSIDNRRTIVNRAIENKGNFLWLYAKNGEVKFNAITVHPLAGE